MNDLPTMATPSLARRLLSLGLRGFAAIAILVIQFLVTGFVCQSKPIRKLEL